MTEDDKTRSVCSQPGDAIQILNTDRDVWKKKALTAEEKLTALVAERDALAKLVECAIEFQFGQVNCAENTPFKDWYVSHEFREFAMIENLTKDDAIAKARELAKGET